MNEKQPLVSVIIPVYNAEKYLEICIDSVIKQDIGFKDNIELVLVNDGSKDESDAICLSYRDKYPNNVVYIKQQNAGASHARNTGLKAAKGEFISFVDADDYISHDSVSAVMNFFSNASKDVDLAIIRVVRVGVVNTERPINRKFDQGTRVVDLNSPEWFDINPRIAPSFIRSATAKTHHFHEEIRFYEDTRYFNEIAARNMKLGVVDEGIYYNRKHEVNDKTASITTGATNEERFYTDSPDKVSLYLLKKYKEKNDYPPLYMQYLAQYEMRWRMFYNSHSPKEVLSKDKYKNYQNIHKEILSLISDEALIGFKQNRVWQRLYLLNMKHNTNILDTATFNDANKLTWNGHTIYNYIKKLQMKTTDMYVSNDKLVIKGHFVELFTDNIKIYMTVNGTDEHDLIETFPNSVDVTTTPLEYAIRKRTGFAIKIPIDNKNMNRIRFFFTLNGKKYPMKFQVVNEKNIIKIGKQLVYWKNSYMYTLPNTATGYARLQLGRAKRHLMILLSKGV